MKPSKAALQRAELRPAFKALVVDVQAIARIWARLSSADASGDGQIERDELVRRFMAPRGGFGAPKGGVGIHAEN